MAEPQVGNWTGGSGQQYAFYLYTLPYDCDPKQDGNYIFARHERGIWLAVYIGQGDLKDRTREGQNDRCIKSKATHLFVTVTAGGEAVRRRIESDLLAGNPEAYVPSGCNIRVGG